MHVEVAMAPTSHTFDVQHLMLFALQKVKLSLYLRSRITYLSGDRVKNFKN